jgi:hypothetical protein
MRIAQTVMLAATLSAPAMAAVPDWDKVDQALGRHGAVTPGDVHRYGFPRTDLHVTLDGVSLLPAFALGGWLAFEPTGSDTMVMGDLVLAEDEINPVMSMVLAGGLAVTALHNHLLRSQPATFYMHVEGHGDPTRLASVLHDALAASRTPLAAPAASTNKPDLDVAQIEQVIGHKGNAVGAVLQFGYRAATRSLMPAWRFPRPWAQPSRSTFSPLAAARPQSPGTSCWRQMRWRQSSPRYVPRASR